MKRDKYMGMDVHQATTVVAVIDAEGKIVLETIVATAAAPIGMLCASCSGATLASPGRVAGRARALTLSWEHRLWPEPAAASVMAVVA